MIAECMPTYFHWRGQDYSVKQQCHLHSYRNAAFPQFTNAWKYSGLLNLPADQTRIAVPCHFNLYFSVRLWASLHMLFNHSCFSFYELLLCSFFNRSPWCACMPTFTYFLENQFLNENQFLEFKSDISRNKSFVRFWMCHFINWNF